MSEATANLQLPFLAAEQAQKHVILNETLLALDCLVQLAVASRNVTEPPEAPEEGARFCVPDDAQGAWATHAGTIAVWQDEVWRFHVPLPGWLMWVEDEARLLARGAQGWIQVTGSSSGGQVESFGIAASPDAENRLAVSSGASLFTHAGSDHRLKINKAATTDTASLLLQNGYSGRVELGLTGDDDFHVKVSPDGTVWHDAIVLDSTTGQARFPSGVSGITGGGVLSAQVTVDFGEYGATSASFDVAVAEALPGQRVFAAPHLPDDVAADELEMDMISAAAAVTQPGRVRLIAASLSGPVKGLRSFNLILTQ